MKWWAGTETAMVTRKPTNTYVTLDLADKLFPDHNPGNTTLTTSLLRE